MFSSPTKYEALSRAVELKNQRPSWWRPYSFKKISLIVTVACSLALLCIVILLQYQEHRVGAVLVARDASGLSNSQIFISKYLPTILIVLFGMWISVIDLDVRRLEPWYQLSRQASASSHPLFCGYDTDFVLTVLLRSVRRNAFIVFGSYTLLILTTMVIPAVQNSMLLSRTQVQSRNVLAGTPPSLVSPAFQTTRMSYDFLSTAYSVCWLGQDEPAFTTRNSTLAPFSNSLAVKDTVATTLNAPTTRYWVELNCWKPASINVKSNASGTFGGDGFIASFDDGRGCNASGILLVDSSVAYTYHAQYEAYYFASASEGSASPGRSLGMLCPQFPHMFLAIWRLRGADYLKPPNFGPRGNATAMFCEPQYYKEPVSTTITPGNNSIVTHEPNGPKEQLSDDVFNRTHFEYLLALGRPPKALTLPVTDIGDQSSILQTTRLKNASISAPDAYSTDNMIGYVLGASKLPSGEYLDYDTPKASYLQAYQLLFALAMTNNFDNEPNATQQATLGSIREVVAIVPGFAIATEVLILLATLACIYLIFTLPRRILYLIRNPDSLAQTMILTRVASTQKALAHLSTVTNDELKASLSNEAFELKTDERRAPFLAHIDRAAPEGSTAHLSIPDLAAHEALKHPPEFSWIVCGLIAIAIVASIVIFVIYDFLSLRQNGLKLPSGTEFTNQLLLSFLPTAFATLLGAYLNLLCRTVSFIKPMEDLKRGNAPASRTLLVNYTSLPAPLVFLKALRVGHYLLAALSFVALISNVLTVTLAGIFLRRDVVGTAAAVLQSTYQPFVLVYPNSDDVIQSSQVDALYPVVANATGQTNLPSWTTSRYGYIPTAQEPTDGDTPVSELEYKSLGYGADLECVDLLVSTSDVASTLEFRNQGRSFLLSTNFTSNSKTCQCSLNYRDSITGGSSGLGSGFGTVAGSLLESTSSFEIVQDFGSYVSAIRGNVTYKLENQCDFCSQRIVHGWIRGRLTPTNNTSTNLTATGRFMYNATIISCRPRVKMQNSLLRILPSGQILTVQELGSPSYDIPPSVNLSATFNTSISALSNRGLANRTWHTDVLARDYSNYLFKKIHGDSAFLNPLQSVPSFNFASSTVSDAFSRIFAAQLFIDRVNLQSVNSSTRTGAALRVRQEGAGNSASEDGAIAATAYYHTQRIFISRPMFFICITILTLDPLVLIIFRLTLSAPFLPRMPFTIASQIAFFAGSHVVDDVVAAGGDLRALDRKGHRYGYGRYVGRDGTVHVGIEREGHIVRSSEKQRGKGERGSGRLRRWTSKFVGRTAEYKDVNGVEFDRLPSRSTGQDWSREG